MKVTNLKKLIPIFIVMCFAVFAALPLFRPGFLPTHDGEYHLIRFHEFETMLKNGYWFPRWAPGLNSGYGVPLFNFHYPLPDYLGVLFHSLGFSLADSFKLVLATGYLSAVIFCFVWLSNKFSKSVAAAAAIVFAYVPYWFVELYVRGEVGEVLALAWFMLIFVGVEKKWFVVVALAYAALVLSHNILALMFTPVLLGYIFLTRPKYLSAIFIGLGISAYFWFPALAEQKYVTGLNNVNYQDYFPALYQLLVPSWGTGLSGTSSMGNEMSYQIGVMPLLIFFAGLMYGLKERTEIKKILRYLLILAGLSAFFILDYSLPVWSLFPFLPLVQYPWRILVMFVPITGFLAAYLFFRLSKMYIIWPVTLLAVILSYSYTRPAIYLPRTDTYYLTRTNFTDGTSSLGNSFSTIWTAWKQERPVKRIEFVKGTGQINKFTEKPLEYNFSVNTTDSGILRVNTLYYPGWKVLIDGKNQLISYKDDGLINFSILSGVHKIKTIFTETPLRAFTDVISILSLLSLFGWFILRKHLWK